MILNAHYDVEGPENSGMKLINLNLLIKIKSNTTNTLDTYFYIQDFVTEKPWKPEVID